MKIFHGSPISNITEFDIDSPSRYTSLEGKGIYMTSDYKIARTYAGSEGSVYEVSLSKSMMLDLTNFDEFHDILKKLTEKTGIDLISLEGMSNTLEGLVSGHYRIRPSSSAGFNWQIKQLLDSNEEFVMRDDCDEIYNIIDDYISEYFDMHDVMVYNDLKLGIVWLGLKSNNIKIEKEISVCSDDEHEYL